MIMEQQIQIQVVIRVHGINICILDNVPVIMVQLILIQDVTFVTLDKQLKLANVLVTTVLRMQARDVIHVLLEVV